MGKLVHIGVAWLSGEEFLEFDPRTLARGSMITTREFWIEPEIEVGYHARCVGNEALGGGTRRIQLSYERKLNPQLAEFAADIPWGTTTIELAQDKAVASYVARSKDEYTGNAFRCDVLSAELFSRRRKQMALVAQRTGQQRLRQSLLKTGKPRCAITGETTLPVLDAAHIIDDALRGVAETSNGLLLRADLHRLFDARPKGGHKGRDDYLTITGAGMVLFSPSLRSHPHYGAYHGQTMADRATLRRVQRSLQEAEDLHGGRGL